MSKKLLYLEDLYDFYSRNYKDTICFDYTETNSPIVVQAHGNVLFEKDEKDTEALLPVHLQSCHIGLNRNKCNISEDAMKSALPSFQNRPILGFIHVVNGEYEFYSHNRHKENDEVVYDEAVVGVVPESCNAQLIYDEEKEKTYCEVDGYIFEEYSKAAEILIREKECPVSVELSIRKMSYDAKAKCLNIEDFFFSGVTILGKDPNGKTINPGMEGSNITLADFNMKDNSLLFNYENKMIEFQERLKKLESACFNKNITKGGVPDMNKKLFDELLAKYNKKTEEITFDYEGLSDEELKAKFAECFEDSGTGNDPEDNPTAEGEPKAGGSGNPSDDELPKKKKFSIDFNGLTRTFEMSCNAKIEALQKLVNETYSETDNAWYGVTVYENDLVMSDYWAGKHYRQAYEQENNSFMLKGDRVEVFVNFLTSEEEDKLKEMKSNYSELVQYKENAEIAKSRTEKEAILSDEKYSALYEKDKNGKFINAGYAELYSNMDKYATEELKKALNAVFGEFVLEAGEFSATDSSTAGKVNKIPFTGVVHTKPKKRYGNLFD